MKTAQIPILLSLFLLGFRLPALAGDYMGADAILKQAEAHSNSNGDSSPKSNPVSLWREDLKQYKDRMATLTPEDAAQSWVALFVRAVKLPSSVAEQSFGSPIPLHALEAFEALPPPADWDALASRVAALPAPEKGSSDLTTPVLRIVTGALQNKPAAIRGALDALRQQTDDLDQSQQTGAADLVWGLEDVLFSLSDDKEGALANFEAKLALLQTSAGATSPGGPREMLHRIPLEAPNLVALAGAARAEDLLKQVFAVHLQAIMIVDAKTKELARKVALDMGDRLKFAPWSLVDSLDCVPLYELLEKRFPGNPDEQPDRRQADAYYLLALITLGRSEDAAKLAVEIGDSSGGESQDALGSLPEEALADLAAKGYAAEVCQFFSRLLAGHPELPYWHSYISAAVLAGQTDAMLSSVKAASERADLKPHAKSELRQAYGDALLAADHVSEALPILRQWVSSTKPIGSGNESDNAWQETAQAAAALAVTGQLLGDDALVNEQLDLLVDIAKTQPEIVSGVHGPSDENLAEIFLAAKRGPEAERILTAALSQGEQALTGILAQPGPPASLMAASLLNEGSYFEAPRTPLFALIDLYYRAGRYQDVVALLNRARSWGAPDVLELVNKWGYEGRTSFLLQAARSLQETGDAAAALRLVNAYLERNGGSDPGYALLLELLPPDQAQKRLDELFQGDQFEERPLIWRAVIQLGQGRLDEAEKSARQAISIDPSDGEEGRGDRMRAYAVLGDILERKGETDKAGQMRQAVRAIRLSEDADRFHAAGLLTRAVAMYEKALGYFADAYCIQSRLAIQLTALGKLDEAMAHYERAYELMPESFGRLESHCFGCERAFAGERAQGTAERVFQKFVDQQPANPRVHYLLGYLRMEEGRKAESAHEFGEAVKLDPDYINAWKQLASATDDPADRDRAELNLLRLDPHNKHGSVDFSVVCDLRALWAQIEAGLKSEPPQPVSLYPLAASRAFLQEEHLRRPLAPAENAEYGDLAGLLNRSEEHVTPVQAILKNKIIAQTLQLLPRNVPAAVPSFQ